MKQPCHADHSRRRWPLKVLGAATAAFGLALAAASTAVAREVVIPTSKRRPNTRVLRLDRDQGTVTLTSSPDTLVPGRYGLWTRDDSAHLRIGDIVSTSRTTVTRQVISPIPDDFKLGRASFRGWYYTSAEDLDLDVEHWAIPTENGPAPAWHFPAATSATERCAILVHGRGVTRHEVLRAVPVFHELGWGVLAVSYRNDGEAPASSDGRYGLGTTEWRDVEAGMQVASASGYRSFVLMGWSMGGAIALQTADRSELRDRILGIVLDSPVIDWLVVLRHQAKLSRIPVFLRDCALWLITHRAGRMLTGQRSPIDFARLDRVAHANDLRQPTLILHSDDDDFVPSDASHALAAARPDLVELETFTRARHTRLWNVDAARWERRISEWLTAHVPPRLTDDEAR